MTGYRLPDAVRWHEGLLLAPQQLQHAALRHEALAYHHAALANPFLWGVRRLHVRLSDNAFHITDLDAVLPDGLTLFHPREGQDLSVALPPVAEVRGRTLLVHLAVPVEQATRPQGGELARWAEAPTDTLPDLYTGRGTGEVPRVRPRVRLVLEGQPLDGLASFPIARLRTAEETLAIDPDFVPPCFVLAAHTQPAERCRRLIALLRDKAANLASRLNAADLQVRLRGADGSERDPLLGEARAVLATLVDALPLFESLVLSPHAHPFQVHQALCLLTGRLAVISEDRLPPEGRPYVHNAIADSFGPLLDFCERTVKAVLESSRAIPFRRDQGMFGLTIAKAWLPPGGAGRLVLGVRRRTGQTDSDAAAWVNEAIIGSQSQIQRIKALRVRGAARSIIDRDEDLGVLPARGQTLFAVEADPAFVISGETLCVANLGDRDGSRAPAEVVLYVPADPAPLAEEASGGS
ncbi:MAG: type VI secretion system baseplate subunit TssK [Rhodospirillaceae bacterium]